MGKDRSRVTVRVVSLGSREAGDSRMGGTVEERLAVVAELTELGWTLAKLPRPTYTRATIPVVITTLAKHLADGQPGMRDDFRDLLAFDVSFIGREVLIRDKRATGRTQDVADIESLEG
jgi:hypothetical protein